MASESVSAWPPSASTIAATALALAATATVLAAAANRSAWPGGVLSSPRKTVRAEDMEGLVYREGLFPGARDVETPVSLLFFLPFLLSPFMIPLPFVSFLFCFPPLLHRGVTGTKRERKGWRGREGRRLVEAHKENKSKKD